MFISLLVFSVKSFAQEDNFQHVLSIGVDPTTTISFSNELVEIDLEFETGISVGYEFRNFPENDWGYSYGLNYHHARSPESLTVKFLGQTASEDISSDETISVIRFNANLISRWESFYIPFGLTYAFVNTGTTTEGGFGFNFSLGWSFNDNIALEYGAFSSVYGSESYNYDLDGVLAVNSLTFKYSF